MYAFKEGIEYIFAVALFINALLFLPQIFRLLKERSSKGVSLLSFSGFFLIQLATVAHAIIIRDAILFSGYVLSMLTTGSVIFLIVFFRQKKPDGWQDLGWQHIVDQLPGHVYWKDKDCRMLGCNKQNWHDFGLSSLSAFVGKTDYDLFDKSIADRLRMVDEEVMREGKSIVVEESVITEEGKEVIYLSHKAPLRCQKGKIVGVLGYSVDITEPKNASKEALSLLENIIAVMPGNVYWMDREGVYLGCNDNEARAVGLESRKAIVGKRNIDMPGFVLPEALDPINADVMRQGKTITVEEPAILRDGSEAIFLSNKVPLRNRAAEVVGMIGISIDITDLKNTEKALKEARERAVEANQTKTEFLMNMRHDLRTPFSGILGLSEILHANEEDVEKRENLALIAQASRQLLDHLNEILEFIKFEEGHLPILDKQINVATMLQGVHSMLMPSATEKGLDFRFEVGEGVPSCVIGDYMRTQRILINLTTNAIKFTTKGSVTLRVDVQRIQEDKIILQYTVRDTGMGIPEEKYNFIFEQFNRLTSSYSGVYPGKGLGLRLVKHFLDEMGGEPHVVSHVGKGSTFIILVPYKPSLLAKVASSPTVPSVEQ